MNMKPRFRNMPQLVLDDAFKEEESRAVREGLYEEELAIWRFSAMSTASNREFPRHFMKKRLQHNSNNAIRMITINL